MRSSLRIHSGSEFQKRGRFRAKNIQLPTLTSWEAGTDIHLSNMVMDKALRIHL